MLRDLLYSSNIYGTNPIEALTEFVYAPVNHPDLLPSLIPLILGAVVIELYFGKYEQEELGWNSSVGNSIIWFATGLTLLLTQELNVLERYATYFLLGVGGVVGYMDFFHKWSSTVAFLISSSGIVYSLAYVTVVFVRTDMAINPVTLKGAALFFLGVNILFKVIQGFERPARDNFRFPG